MTNKTESQRAVAIYLQQHQQARLSDIGEALCVTDRAARYVVSEMVARGMLIRVKRGIDGGANRLALSPWYAEKLASEPTPVQARGYSMRLINRGSKQSPIARQACEVALETHHARYGDYGRQKQQTNYVVEVNGMKVTVEVVNRSRSYVATAMTGMRRLRALPGQVS